MEITEEVFVTAVPEYSGTISAAFLAKALNALRRYKSDLSRFREKVKDNDKWYKCNYGKPIQPGTNEPAPATAFIANAIFNRYADFIDNYPVPNILERDPDNTETAKKLREIVPLLLESTSFKRKYKRNCYNKMKNGAGIYGVFFNEETHEIDITVVDVLDFYCDIHVDDLQDSQFVFVCNAMDNDELKEAYPEFASLFTGSCSIEGRESTYTLENRTEVVDCYYKKTDGTVHMMKLVNESIIIDSTEDKDGYENGLYNHGKYPFVIDTMYLDDDNLMGFSLIDITRNPQMYIDKLDAAILKNAMLSSHPRWLIKDTGGINKKEFTDMSKEVITSATDVDEKNIKMFQVNSLPTFVREHREKKIDELKEISGNRDWTNGGTSNGVTAASAIEALQSSGQKLSRANIDDTYDSYKEIIYMVIELVRQFFSKKETYRITDENGQKDFVQFSAQEMYSPVKDVFGFGNGERKRADFDVSVVVQKENPFTRETNNQTINALWAAGYFLPDNMELSIMALQCMHFDAKDKLVELMQEYMKKKQQEQQQAQTQQQEQAANGDETAEPVEEDQTGNDDLIPVGQAQEQPSMNAASGGSLGGSASMGGEDMLIPVGGI